MTTKIFTVTFTSDESTRWLQDDYSLTVRLQSIANTLGSLMTSGNEPAVEVFKDEGQQEFFIGKSPLPPR